MLVTETLDHDGGRAITVHIPDTTPEAIVFTADGALVPQWGPDLEVRGLPSTMIVGVARASDDTLRLHEYSPTFDPAVFAAHERFFVDHVRAWVTTRFAVALPAARTAVLGVSAGGELALALGLRHPHAYGAVLCASPGAGFRPPPALSGPIPRTYLVSGSDEPLFTENATRWAGALRAAGADVVQAERPGSHGGPFWRAEFPRMLAWAFGCGDAIGCGDTVDP